MKILKLITLSLILILVGCKKKECTDPVTTNYNQQLGKVIDEHGYPQTGCKVTSLETGESVYTDFDGYYQINVPLGSLLVFEFVSYRKETLSAKNNLVVQLKDIQLPSTVSTFN